MRRRRATWMLTGLLALATPLADPPMSAAALPIACHLLSPATVARAAPHKGHIYARGVVQRGYGASGVKDIFSLCEYRISTTPFALLVISEMTSLHNARREFSQYVLAASKGGGRRPISGPWEAGYECAYGQVIALKGRRVTTFSFAINLQKPVKYRRGLSQSLMAAAVRQF